MPTRLFCPWDSPGQEYWNGFPGLSPGDLLNSGIEPGSPTLQADSFLSEPPGEEYKNYRQEKKKIMGGKGIL